jgi:hypothetical protein
MMRDLMPMVRDFKQLHNWQSYPDLQMRVMFASAADRTLWKTIIPASFNNNYGDRFLANNTIITHLAPEPKLDKNLSQLLRMRMEDVDWPEEGVTLWFKDKGLDKPINVGWVNTQFNCLPPSGHRSSAYNKGQTGKAAGVRGHYGQVVAYTDRVNKRMTFPDCKDKVTSIKCMIMP